MPPDIWVNARFVTQPLSGIQRYAHNLASRLSDLPLIAPAPPRPEYADLSAERFTLRPSPLKSHLWEQLVLPGVPPRNALLWSPAGIGPLRHPCHVLTVHDLSFHDVPECFSRPYLAWFGAVFPQAVRRARTLLTVSEFSKSRLMQVYGVAPEKIHVVLSAAGPRFVPPSAENVAAMRREQNLASRYILALGDISPRKNFQGLLAAWRKIAGQYPDVELVVAGAKNLSFSSAGTLGAMPPRTRHLTGVSDDVLLPLYAGASVFAYPSLYEGFGLPVLEAMQIGTPVLTSNNTSIPEVAGDAALLVDPHSTAEIANGLCRLLDDSDLRDRLRTAGFAQSGRFTWDDTARNTRDVLMAAV